MVIKWTVFAGVIPTVFCVAVVVGVNRNAVQSFPWPHSVIQMRPSYCDAYTLSGASFMRSLHAVITHGDLSDISFIEKTFGTKFDSQTSGSKDYFYETDDFLGAPIHIDLYVDALKADRIKGSDFAFMRISSDYIPYHGSYFIRDCLHISPFEFQSYFSGGFEFLLNDGGGAGGIQGSGSRGKDASNLKLSFSYQVNTPLIDVMSIHQSP